MGNSVYPSLEIMCHLVYLTEPCHIIFILHHPGNLWNGLCRKKHEGDILLHLVTNHYSSLLLQPQPSEDNFKTNISSAQYCGGTLWLLPAISKKFQTFIEKFQEQQFWYETWDHSPPPSPRTHIHLMCIIIIIKNYKWSSWNFSGQVYTF